MSNNTISHHASASPAHENQGFSGYHFLPKNGKWSRIFLSKKNLINLSYILFLSLFLIGCHQGKFDPFDRQTGLSKEEIRNTLIADKSARHKKYDLIQPQTPVPRSSRMLAVPPPPKVGGSKLISFSATDDVPLKDILIELGRVTKIDVDVDPSITGGVIINANRRPLKEVLDRISDMANLTYSFENNILHFKRDLPFPKHYLVDYLIDGALWAEVESNLTNIIADATSQNTSSLSSNKAAGILTVFATTKQHIEVEKYLKEVEKNASSQVLIEAKVIEVTLSDEFRSGIVWNLGGGPVDVGNSSGGTATTNPFSIALTGNGILGGNLDVTLTALEKFGSVRAISSPRISALNNQKAKLNFVDRLVYFTIEVEQSDTTSTALNQTTTVTATKNEEPVGVELSITPSINLSTNEITLNVNPKLSVSTTTAIDPSVNPATGDSLGNKIPIVQTRELTTTMKVQSGGTLVIGGLMKESTDNTDQGVPFLNKIPLLGYLFKSTTRATEVVETVIFIKATIVTSGSGINKYDRKFHNNFTSDRKQYLE